MATNTISKNKPEDTRKKIIDAAFKEIYKHGYQGMRIDQVLKNTDLKKGALYYHFSSKQELGYAVLDEDIAKKGAEMWIEPLNNFADPLDGIYTLFIQNESASKSVWGDEVFILGCPVNNLAQEMSPIDEGFRERIVGMFKLWKGALSDALKKGQQKGIVDPSINTEDSAMFILTIIEGAWGLTKVHQDKEVYLSCGRELKRYLNSLKVKKLVSVG
jgi:AcrR family transcriptional regulator